MPKLSSIDKCCGCAACFNACNLGAIQMIENIAGFLYPSVDEKKCIECHSCENACPVLSQNKKSLPYEPVAFVGRINDDRILAESTSGGVFTGIASWIISRGGVVFGAAFGENFTVMHTYTESIDGIGIFRNSKYVQSEVGDSYRRCKEFLLSDRWVCFSGTPCQIKGLLTYLGKNYKKLITVDIVCHSAPSQLIFKKYMELQIKQYPTTQKVVFRDKGKGYSYSTMALYDSNNKCLYRKGSESDIWFRSFLPGLCDRENCYNCDYQQYPRLSDITIWDCFTVSSTAPEFDDDKGATSIICWTPTGRSIIESNHDLLTKKVDISLFINKINRETEKKIEINREVMYEDAIKMEASEFFKKYRPISLKSELKMLIRSILHKLGLQKIAKDYFTKMRVREKRRQVKQ